ncbi:MAG: RecQ family ATP-dependent DNA helicase [Bacteroidaceae bacterium]|nr:RecQ family ATP-dependent DNA helicase [Bacteroidaceae bacterium]
MTFRELLKEHWGFDSFRGIQEEIIESIAQGKDTLGLMPTGGGKSICFQVPTLAMDGLNIVVTPLISLMKDQVSRLRMNGIKAEAVYSGMMRDDISRAYDNCIYGNYKFLYISPERLGSELFRQKLAHIPRICMITVDEAHCVSQWGYDFRPSYLRIVEVRHLIPYHVPVLALTATATPKVVDDIQDKLEFKEHNVFSMSFERKNLAYIVRQTVDKTAETLSILQKMPQGSAIVYTRSRRLTSELAKYLIANGITADNYHAGLTDAEKDLRHINWSKGRNRVMVATNAFGMGIDKADVRLVIHYNVPDSIESYFQEAGRAGRDGEKSYAVLLYNRLDDSILRRRVNETYPDPEYIRQTYEDVCHFLQVGTGEGCGRTFDFSLEKFCKYFRHFANTANSALRLLNNAGYIDYAEDNDFKSRVHIILHKEELYLLNSREKQIDTLIHALLRNYTGLFADFEYIDENYLSHLTGLDVETVYRVLKDLNQRRIIDYIPRRNTPTVMFRIGRVDKEEIGLPPYVYEDRKADFARRIEEMIHYASEDNQCRSKMLLAYFGEPKAEECGGCDVCIRKKKMPKQEQLKMQMSQKIDGVLADGEWHTMADLWAISGNEEDIRAAVKWMIAEEEVVVKSNKIKKK